MKSLLGLTPEEIQELIQAKERFRSRQIYHALYTGIDSFDAITDLPLAMREQLSENFSIFTSKIDTSLDDEESNCKLRIELSDGLFTECVILSDGTDRKTICISSQVGCKMGCAFCRTADLGFMRNLSS
ncbi:MAG: 23S rRNA (adenine(2503)-C2)-methyltransferase, partial [Spirochaetales bacterium]|nr:23S rRNA (adenine(2503)-C2)-methyltransferase [Spirochaetales bacterium]